MNIHRSLTVLAIIGISGQVLVAALLQSDDRPEGLRYGEHPFLDAQYGKLDDLRETIERVPEVLHDTDRLGRTLLHSAAMADRGAEVAEYLISEGIPVDARDEDGKTPLYAAAYAGALESAKVLVRHGADVNAREGGFDWPEEVEGDTVLSAAAYSGNLELVKYLLEQGAEIEYGRGDSRDTALHRASWIVRGGRTTCDGGYLSWHGNNAVIDLLAGRVGDINVRDGRGYTPLHIAARHGAVRTVRHILEIYPEADVNARNQSGQTPLYLAADDAFSTPTGQDRATIVKLLIQHGADPDTRTKGDNTPLDRAREANNPIVMKALGIWTPAEASKPSIKVPQVKASDDHSAKQNGQEITASQRLMIAMATDVPGDSTEAFDEPEVATESIFCLARKGNLAELKVRIERNPELIQAQRDKSLLHAAAGKARFDVVEYLLSRGANVDARDGLGFTPLHRAIGVIHENDEPIPPAEKEQRFQIVQALVAAGADVNAGDGAERTPLHLAARNNLPRVVEFFIERDARIDARDSNGMTPLHWAAGSSRAVEVLKMLVRQGADPTARIQPPRPPRDNELPGDYNSLSLAAMWGNLDMVRFLLEQEVPTRYGSGESEHSALYDAIWAASAARDDGADRKQIAKHFAVIDLLAEEMGGIHAGVQQETYEGTALQLASSPYIVRHLLTKYSSEFTTQDIEAAIEKLEKQGDSGSSQVRARRKETLDALHSAHLIYAMFEAK